MQTRAYVRIIYIIMITWEQVPKHHEKKKCNLYVPWHCREYIHKNLLYFFNEYKIRSKATNLKQEQGSKTANYWSMGTLEEGWRGGERQGGEERKVEN